MRFILSIAMMMVSYVGFCQNKNALDFYPLAFMEKISNVTEMRLAAKATSLPTKDFFFIEKYKNDFGLFLIRKENGTWSVYDFETKTNGSNMVVKEIKAETSRFVSIQLFRTPSGTCESTYGTIILLDLVTNEWTDFCNYNRFECAAAKASSTPSECEVKFHLKGNYLEMKSTKKRDDGLYCFESGKYKYADHKFIPIK